MPFLTRVQDPAVWIGGKLLGIVGALLALPVAAGLRIIFEELRFALPAPRTPRLL